MWLPGPGRPHGWPSHTLTSQCCHILRDASQSLWEGHSARTAAAPGDRENGSSWETKGIRNSEDNLLFGFCAHLTVSGI